MLITNETNETSCTDFTGRPRLRDTFNATEIEGSENISFNLLQSLDNELRVNFTWTKDGRPLNTEEGIVINESYIHFDRVRRSDTGNYLLTITTYLDNGNSQTTTGGFFLDVLCMFNASIYNNYSACLVYFNTS